MATTAIRGLQLSSDQYRLLQEPEFELPDGEELFNFEVKRLRDAGLTISNQELAALKKLIPKKRMLFLLIPTPPSWRAIFRILDDVAKKKAVTGVECFASPNMNVIESLASDETYAKPHMLLLCSNGENVVERSATDRAKHLVSSGKVSMTLWQMIVSFLVYPAIAENHQLMALGSIEKPPVQTGKRSPVLQRNDQVLQVVMRSWDDAVDSCIFPYFREAQSAEVML